MNRYKNTVTGAIIDTECEIYGENWEKVETTEKAEKLEKTEKETKKKDK